MEKRQAMKLLITTLTIIFISFGTCAYGEIQSFLLPMKDEKLKECLKVKLKSTKPLYEWKDESFYYHEGFIYKLTKFSIFNIMVQGICERTTKPIF